MLIAAPNLNVRWLILLEVCPREEPVRLSEDHASGNSLDDVSSLHTSLFER
jgi:hypothetical protein